MELSWSTFILEIINFLVLVWILKHFLYQPVLHIIERRQAAITEKQHHLDQSQAEATRRQQLYEGRLAEWNIERQKLRESLNEELETERRRQQAMLQKDLQKSREKQLVSEASREAELLNRAESAALQQAAQFATRLLQLGAGADTEQRLLEILIDSLLQLPADRVEAIRHSIASDSNHIEVVSAYRVEDSLQARLNRALQRLSDQSTEIHYRVDKALIAGIRITIGSWILGANLQDELKGLAQLESAGHCLTKR